MICDYHLHSEFSFDSSEKIENIVEKALQMGIDEIALTDHAEFPLRDTAPWPDFVKREAVLATCRDKYGVLLAIRSGIETGQPWRDAELEMKLTEAKPDLIIASAHELDGYSDPRSFPFSRENVKGFIDSYLTQMTQMASACDYDVIDMLHICSVLSRKSLQRSFRRNHFRRDTKHCLKLLSEEERA